MAFESLSERLGKTFENITGKGKLSEKNMSGMLREVCMSLLEADINYGVVKDLIAHVKEQALGTEVITSLSPGQMIVKIIRDEIVALLGSEDTPVNYKSSGTTTVMMVGLQGTGKTTTSAKIANIIKKRQSRRPLLTACNVIRPAAIEQLKALGESIDAKVFSLGVGTRMLEAAKQSMNYAEGDGYDTILFDITGRLYIDEELIQELSNIKALIHPDDILLTVDAMTGQDIANVAGSFHKRLEATGLVLTKLDGDSRGGGTPSVRSITQAPVKFVGLGEKINNLDVSHPDRMADRILGMGDIMPLVEQAQDKMDIEANAKSVDRMMSGQPTLTDMLVQFQQLEKIGSLDGMMKLIPGMNQLIGQINEAKAGNKMKKSTAIIRSMTMEKWKNPNILCASRKNRITKGSGTTVADVNRPLNEYEKMKQVMEQMGAITKSGKMPNMGGTGAMGAMENMRSMNKIMCQGGKRGKR